METTESLFIGPKNQKDFGKEDRFYVPEPSRWNRKLYYLMNDPKLLNVKSLDIKVDLKNMDDLIGISGIWEIWGRRDNNSSLQCLDVHETLDLEYEIRMHEKDLEFVRSLDWHADEFKPLNLFSLWKRLKAITQWLDLDVRVVAMNVHGKLNRELIEAQRAWDVKSVYWNRNYFQPVTYDQMVHQKTVEYIINRR